MELNIERDGAILVAIATEERVDSANAREFQAALEDAIEETDQAVILDAGHLIYISSAGLRVILLIAKSLNRQGGQFAVCSLCDSIREIFAISGFDNIIPIKANKADAIAAIKD